MNKEPVLILLAGLAVVVNLGLVAANALGWITLVDGQIAAVVAFVTGACALVAAVLRSAVVSPATSEARQIVAQAQGQRDAGRL